MEATRTNELVAGWLGEHGAQVVEIFPADERSLLLGEVAAGAGEVPLCATLLRTIGWNMQRRREDVIYLTPKGASSNDVGRTRAYARMLADIGYIEQSWKPKGRAFIAVRPLRRTPATALTFDDVQRFCHGQWFEYYALGVAHSVHGEAAALAHNVEVVMRGESFVEIDLFGVIGESTPMWVECKSGNNGFQRRLARYATFTKRLGLEARRSILAVRGVEEQQAHRIGVVHGLTVVSADRLPDAVAAAA